MSTCNFSTVNAANFYAMNKFNHRTADDIRDRAEGRADAAKFSARNDWEPRFLGHRDSGLIVLDYQLPDADLPGDALLCITGEIIIRPGYYAGAVLDWNLKAAMYAPDFWDRWSLEDWDGVDMLDDMTDAWVEAEGQEGQGARDGAARAIREALEKAGATLDQICRELCDVPLGCAGVASSGEAFYYALS